MNIYTLIISTENEKNIEIRHFLASYLILKQLPCLILDGKNCL
jgi:hypothetical protein